MGKLRVILVLLLISALPMSSSAIGKNKPTHMDPLYNPDECAGCHAGRGTKNTPLLKERLEKMCFVCHGSMTRGKSSINIESVFVKPSRHPVLETTVYHRRGEELPERMNTVPRHVSCYDCHIVHATIPEKTFNKVGGYAPGKLRLEVKGPPAGMKLPEATTDFELCYLCHSDSANLPVTSRNVSLEFDPSNESFHPVEMPGRNKSMPSLLRGLSPTDTITCGDCHGNNDRTGPKGPHGSDYAPLLVAEYRTQNGVESQRAYALCYGCHDRRSILQNDSFNRHKEHIVFYAGGTSCFACHASHGSRPRSALIEFAPDRVSASVNAGTVNYINIPKAPRCSLLCHGAEHNANDLSTGAAGRPWPE